MLDKPKSEAAAALPPTAAVLSTESGEDFDQIRDALYREIKPKGPIEEIFVPDFAHLTWDIARLRRCKTALINSALPEALKWLLHDTVRFGFGAEETSGADEGGAEEGADEGADENAEEGADEGADEQYEVDPDDLAVKWFIDKAAKQQVADLLALRGLDESAIEAQVLRLMHWQLELIDRLLASAEARRIKALRSIAEYRVSFAKRLRDGSDRVIEGEIVAVEADADSATAA